MNRRHPTSQHPKQTESSPLSTLIQSPIQSLPPLLLLGIILQQISRQPLHRIRRPLLHQLRHSLQQDRHHGLIQIRTNGEIVPHSPLFGFDHGLLGGLLVELHALLHGGLYVLGHALLHLALVLLLLLLHELLLLLLHCFLALLEGGELGGVDLLLLGVHCGDGGRGRRRNDLGGVEDGFFVCFCLVLSQVCCFCCCCFGLWSAWRHFHVFK